MMRVGVLCILNLILPFLTAINASGEGGSSKSHEIGKTEEPSISNFQWEKTSGDVAYHSAKEIKYHDFAHRAHNVQDINSLPDTVPANREFKKKADLRPVIDHFKRKAKKQIQALTDLALVRKLPGPKTRQYLLQRNKLPKNS